MFFKTLNSSFILERLRRSIRLCAVFRAIFLPATLVLLGCFFLAPASPFFPPAVFVVAGASSSFGFICMIFLLLVGGGGSVKVSFSLLDVETVCLRLEGVSTTRMTGERGELG